MNSSLCLFKPGFYKLLEPAWKTKCLFDAYAFKVIVFIKFKRVGFHHPLNTTTNMRHDYNLSNQHSHLPLLNPQRTNNFGDKQDGTLGSLRLIAEWKDLGIGQGVCGDNG